jgi:hypothetical protein
LLVLLVCFISLNGSSTAMAWDNGTTHVDLSDVAAQRSILSNGFLVNTLALKNGLDEKLLWGGANTTNQSIRKWIQDGANFEDHSPRYLNHFHQPLLPWESAGLNDSILGKSVTGESALLWAQNGGLTNTSNTDWSWQATRQHYANALTAQLKTTRDAELAQTFVGIGHASMDISPVSQVDTQQGRPVS